MYAFEFNAEIEHGSIKILEQYLGKLGVSRVKVIILAKQLEEKKSVPNFPVLRINTKGYKFDRELANER